MLKNLESITGSSEISKNNQKALNGGLTPGGSGPQCYYYNSGYNNNGAVCDADGYPGRCATGVCSPDCPH